MSAVYYFHLINPMVMAIFAVGFWLVYRSDRSMIPALFFAWGFGAGSLAFGIAFIGRIALGVPTLIHFCNLVILLSAAAISYGISLHLSRTTSWRLFGLATMFVVMGWLLAMPFVPAPASRIGLTYGGTALLLCLCLPVVWGSLYRPTGRLLLVLVSSFVALGLLRLAFALLSDPATIEATNALDSFELVFATMTSALFSIAIAATLLFSLAIEIVRRLTRASGTDYLSGILNRRGFQEQAETLLDRARRSPISVSFVMADLDHFKSINDRHGHPVGDDVIAEFGQMLKSMCRSADLVGRIGGEEFAVLLWNCDERGARLFAEAARETWKVQSAPLLPEGCCSSASFGVATMTGAETTLSLLVDTADAALMNAKNAGRDCVRAGSESMAEGEAPQGQGQSDVAA